MITKTLEELKVELQASLAVLEPRRRGLEDLQNVSLTETTKVQVGLELTDTKRREGLLNTALAAIAAVEQALAQLDGDGYPEQPSQEVDTVVYQELQEQKRDLEEALARFHLPGQAVSIAFEEAVIEDKPK